LEISNVVNVAVVCCGGFILLHPLLQVLSRCEDGLNKVGIQTLLDPPTFDEQMIIKIARSEGPNEDLIRTRGS